MNTRAILGNPRTRNMFLVVYLAVFRLSTAITMSLSTIENTNATATTQPSYLATTGFVPATTPSTTATANATTPTQPSAIPSNTNPSNTNLTTTILPTTATTNATTTVKPSNPAITSSAPTTPSTAATNTTTPTQPSASPTTTNATTPLPLTSTASAKVNSSNTSLPTTAATTSSLTKTVPQNSTTFSSVTSTAAPITIETTKSSKLRTTDIPASTSTRVFSTSKTISTPNPNIEMRNEIADAGNSSGDIVQIFGKFQSNFHNSSSADNQKTSFDGNFSQSFGEGISDLTNTLTRKDFPKDDWISITNASINLSSKVENNMTNVKLALNNLILVTSDKILDIQPPEEEFYLNNEYADIAGIKSNPDNLEGFELETNYGDLIVPSDMKESDSTVLFKMICYKNDINVDLVMENKTQLPTIHVSIVNSQNSPIANSDPDKTYKIVLKSKNAITKNWQNIEENAGGISGFQVPLTEKGLSLVELSFSDGAVWGKMNEAPTRYDYHFYYSTLKDNKNVESIVKVKYIKVERYDSVLRILIQSQDQRNSLYLRVDSPGSQRLKKRAIPAKLKTRTSTVQPLIKKRSFIDKYEPFNLQDTSIDKNYNVILKTNLFGTFTSVISFVTPQTLDFEKIFVDFDKKVMNNPYVLIVLLLIFLLYCILAVMVRRLDKKDQINWLYLPLSDNNCSDLCQYLIRVHTGLRSSRVMSATPYFILRGTKGETDIRILSDGVRKNLSSGTVYAYLLRTCENLGTLLTVKIWHNNEGSSPRWFLSNIDIKDVTNDTWYSFPCNDWLAFDKGDGAIIRLLEPHSNLSDNFFINIKTRIHIGLFDDHLYFSIVKRPRSSHFTRLQRLSTLVAVLYLSLISSAMYYKPTDKIPSRSFTLGPFTLTSKEIVVGIISSVIMVLPASVIIALFKYCKVKGEESDTCGSSLTIVERFQRFRLPWWSVYFAYLLVFLSIGVSAFFTFMYSIVWGKELALQWLLSIVINVTGSVIFIQPIKIITLAMLTSCILQSPQQEYEDSKKYFSEESEDVPPGEVKICLPPNMSTKRWKNKKRTMKLNNKLSKIFQSFSFNLVYVIICFIFLINERINTKFYQNNAIKRQLQLGKLKQNRGCDAIWDWIMRYSVPVIFPYKGYNGQILTINSQMFLADQVNLRLGAVRFRQLRTEGGWKRKNRTKDESILTAFRYTSSADSGEDIEQMGVLEHYQNGGYIMDINHRYKKAKSILQRLKSSDWLDEHTRCLFICLNSYNANTGLYMQTIIQMEKLFLGNVLSVVKVISFRFYPFVDLMDYFMLLILIILVCITIANIVSLVKYVMKTRELLSWTVFLSLLRLISLLMIIIGYILRIDRLLIMRDKLISNPEKYISGDALIFQERIYLSGLCGFILVTTLKLCQPLSMNYYFFLMKASIVILLPYLRSFIIFLTVILSSFSFSIHVLFYNSVLSFCTLGSAYLALFRVFLLLTKFHQIFKEDTVSLHFIFFMYTFFSAIILMNICISMLNESFTCIKKIQLEICSEYKFDWELNQHFWTQLINFFHSKKNTQTTLKESVLPTKNEDSPNFLDSLSKVDKILESAIVHHGAENKAMQLKCLTLYHMICQYRHILNKSEQGKMKIKPEAGIQVTNKLHVKKERNENDTWTYWYYYDDCHPLLKISFQSEDEDPGEIICRHIEEDILSKTQNGLLSYTLLGPTIEIHSNGLEETKKNEFEIVYFCLEPLHHYYCCELLQSLDGTTWLGNSPQQLLQTGVEEHILQDVIHVGELPAYLTLVRRPRREYLCWDNKNGEKFSLLEPSLSLCLSPRDIGKTACSAILKMELEDCFPIVVLTLNVEIEDPIIVRFQEMNTIDNLPSQLYTQTNSREWNEESQVVKDNFSFRAKPQANQETRHMLRPSQIKWDWRNEIRCLKDPLNEELFLKLSQKVGNKWKELGKNLGIPPRAILRIKNSTSDIHPEMACFEVLTQWHKCSVMTASKIEILRSALSIIDEDLSQTMDDIAEKYENKCSTFIQESVKIKFFDQISRSEIMVSSWKELAKRLGLTETDIEKIDKCTILTAREKCYNALMSWETYNRETLRQQLTEMGFSFLAGKVQIDGRENELYK